MGYLIKKWFKTRDDHCGEMDRYGYKHWVRIAVDDITDALIDVHHDHGAVEEWKSELGGYLRDIDIGKRGDEDLEIEPTVHWFLYELMRELDEDDEQDYPGPAAYYEDDDDEDYYKDIGEEYKPVPKPLYNYPWHCARVA
ncbi:hypothetical protein IV203_038338 [Nitzschia inconspicua]|uniref:Uncharacterized protein n=1 Tax=Nitzschia inconspicua TaxID=303405 RepID=A0A9K3LME9_9STRA|nr:hypothetical protein IV203_038338 [Nitzschia inconspicua]